MIHFGSSLLPVILSASIAIAETSPDAIDSLNGVDGVDGIDNAVPADRVVVVGERSETRWLQTPASISVVHADEIQRGQQQLTLGESLGRLPGVFIQNRSNFAQDSRISIRGFGARTPFGIRGVQLIVDGIPQTLPDGQGQVDSLDLSIASRIEVLRGPGASLYGSAAGGVIEVTSFAGGPEPHASARVALGSFGFQNYQMQGSGQQGRTRYAVGLSGTIFDGDRDHSRSENILFNTKFETQIDDQSEWMVVVSHADAPEADDPGALTAQEVKDDREQANARNVDMKSGEELLNTTIGTRYRYRFDEHHETALTAWFTWRDFDGRVPSTSRGAIDLERFFAGGSATHTYRHRFFDRNNRMQFGVDVDGQRDQRKQRAIDLTTGAVGQLAIDETQNVTSVGVFLHDSLAVADGVELSISARYDWVEFEVDDDFKSDSGGDDSDQIDFDAWSFSGAAVWNPTPAFNPFLRVGTSFETPTTTALANPDTDAGGFNDRLDAQTSIQYELGSKGWLGDLFRYEVSAYYIRVDDELLPYTRDFSTFYENAERSDRLGFEFALHARIHPLWSATASYTHSRFEFDDFTDDNGNRFDGNAIPGVPRNMASLEIDFESPSGAYVSFDVQYVDEREADNANSAEAEDYVLANVSTGYAHSIGLWEIEGFFGINNLTDQKYDDNLRINANFGRFYEPAPGRNFHVGIGASCHF